MLISFSYVNITFESLFLNHKRRHLNTSTAKELKNSTPQQLKNSTPQQLKNSTAQQLNTSTPQKNTKQGTRNTSPFPL